MKRQLAAIGLAAVLCGVAAGGVQAQQSCDDGNECTGDGICQADGSCSDGTPVENGTPCGGEVVGACVTGQACQNGMCTGGTEAADGTPCKALESPCFTEGTCLRPLPGVPPVCLGSLPVVCQQDDDLCTVEACNPATGACESFPICLIDTSYDPQCVSFTCNPVTHECTYAMENEGAACDDGNECTASSHCTAGICVAGGGPGPTPTPTETPTVACIGDCTGDGIVTIEDIVILINAAKTGGSAAACPNGDANGDSHITVDDILHALANALYGC
jgi:hypothetical protein